MEKAYVLPRWLWSAGWIALLVVGLIPIITLFALHKTELAIAAVVSVIGLAIAWGSWSSYHWSVRRQIQRHTRLKDLKAGAVLRAPLPTNFRPDLQRVIDRLHRESSGSVTPFGIASNITMESLVSTNSAKEVLRWDYLPGPNGTSLQLPRNAFYLLRHGPDPVCLLIYFGEATSYDYMQDDGGPVAGKGPSDRGELQIFARDRTVAQGLLDEIRKNAWQDSIYKNRVLTLERSRGRDEQYRVTFHEMSETPRERIVLGDALMQSIERNVLGFLAQRDTLRKLGQSTRRGVLFHGAPGTGKSLVARYLAGVCDCTVIILSGRRMRLLREACFLARMLAPTLIILEDIDLIAQDRQHNRTTALLHDLLEEMDGMGPQSECIFLLTTNRPEVLEMALAARPGRVDQTIFFPLPNRDERRRLFDQFGKNLDLSQVDVEAMLDKTEGASPAFIQELFRKLALLAAERGAQTAPLAIRADDVREALRDILETGGPLTQQLLGFLRRGGSA
jgi:AAA+ superfamily predicted ATPase